MRPIHTIRRRLAAEEGMSLIMAIGIMGVLSIVGAAMLFYAGSNSRSAEYSNADNRAYAAAEAGVAQGLATIGAATDPSDGSILATPKTVDVDGEQVTYGGTKTTDADGNTVWTVTATSVVDNPTGPSAQDVSRTVRQKVRVLGLINATDPADWDRVFHNRTDKCLVITTIEIPASVTSRGDICIEDWGQIRQANTNNPTVVRAGDDVFINHAQSKIGDNNADDRIQRVEIGGLCKYKYSPATGVCDENDGVFAIETSYTPTRLEKPEVDFDYWYQNAKPGPKHPCTSGFFPGGFDNDAVMNGSRTTNSGEITPKSQSYSCKVVEDGELVGEISWNHITHVLTIHGTIFIDGDIRFDDDGQLVNYQGRATIYAGDDVEFDERVCAGGDGSWNCRDEMENWNPEENLMILISRGWSEYDQGGSLAPAAFQGIVYARDFCLMHQDIYISGPMLCDDIRIEKDDEDQGGGWPTLFSWPQLQSLIPGVLYGDVSESTTYEMQLLEQTS